MLNDSSVFDIGSVSKQFTATAILLLKDRGQLKLTDSLRQYFPELPYSNISIWNMLTHTSGLPDYESLMQDGWDQKTIVFNKDMIAFLAKEKSPVHFLPGTKWEYSNTAYAILASIVEKVSGQKFSSFMTKNIFAPLKLRHTRTYNTRRSSKDTIANYAFGFIYKPAEKKYIIPDLDSNYRFVIQLDGIEGDGIVNSTTTDLLAWDRAVKAQRLLKPETQREMLSYQSLADTARKLYYGYAVFLENGKFGNTIGHSGGWPGYVSFLSRNTDKDQTYIVLSNNESGSPNIAVTLENIMAGNDVLPAYEHKAIQMDSAALDAFVGSYKIGTASMRIERRGGQLFRVNPNGRSVELMPESASKLFYTDGTDRQLEFELDADKKFVEGWAIIMGVKTAITKL